MTSLSEVEKYIADFNAKAEALKIERDALLTEALDAGLSKRAIGKLIASVTVKMPEG